MTESNKSWGRGLHKQWIPGHSFKFYMWPGNEANCSVVVVQKAHKNLLIVCGCLSMSPLLRIFVNLRRNDWRI